VPNGISPNGGALAETGFVRGGPVRRTADQPSKEFHQG